MDVARLTSILALTAFLVVAVVQDLRSLRVSNRLILLGICVGIPLRIWTEGVGEAAWILLGIIFPVITLYLFYLLGILGAADIKLFSMIGSFINIRELIYSMIAAFVIGAVFSVLKMLWRRDFLFRMSCGIRYILESFQGQLRAYDYAGDEDTIHFSLAILLGLYVAMLFIGR